jgi:Protein of unknown function (DUF1579).
MSKRSVSLFVLVVFALALPLIGGDEKKAAAPSAEEKAMMDAWMKAATPGDMHKKLGAFVGTWDVNVKMWEKPGGEAMESAGKAVNSWALDGRWVEQQFEGQFMGMPMHGIGYTGYDNVKKSYVSTWMDTISTSVMSSAGSADADGKTMTFMGSMDDPMTGKPVSVKEVVRVVDADHHVMEMWNPAPDGQMFKSMEITYSRAK